MQVSGLTVSQVVKLAKELLESQFFNLWVEGEISDLTDRGHVFFTLKDEHASIRAVMYRYARRFLRFPLKDGMKVVCRGRLTIYELRGDFQILVEEAIPKGLGELQAAFEELKRKLAAEGLFDESRKKPLPEWIERMAVVTSPTGAAIRDVVVNSTQRAPWIKISIYPVHVQGRTAAREIAAALDELNKIGGFDIIVITRGGGSLQDLWSFNEEVVARAIARSKIAVVSAVGHEQDYTIADFTADVRVSTPTAVARLLVSQQEIRRNVTDAAASLAQFMRALVERERTRLTSAKVQLLRAADMVQESSKRVANLHERIKLEAVRAAKLHTKQVIGLIQNLKYLHPQKRVARWKREIDQLQRRLIENATGITEHKRLQLVSLHSRLNDLSPLGVLARGYGIVLKQGQIRVVKSFDEVKAGEDVDVALAKGGLVCRVTSSSPDAPKQLPRGTSSSDER